MPALKSLVARDDMSDPTMLKVLIALAVLTASLLIGLVAFVTIRAARKRRALAAADTTQSDKYRRLTIETISAHVLQEKRALIESSSSPPASPLVPEIRITFPDEVDKSGRPQSGRVVVVRMGENASVGLEPLQDEQLPPYEKFEGTHRFESLDLERMGGLKEKELEKRIS